MVIREGKGAGGRDEGEKEEVMQEQREGREEGEAMKKREGGRI